MAIGDAPINPRHDTQNDQGDQDSGQADEHGGSDKHCDQGACSGSGSCVQRVVGLAGRSVQWTRNEQQNQHDAGTDCDVQDEAVDGA